MAKPIVSVHEIETLSPIERAQRVDTVMRNLFALGPDIRRAWAIEASSRWDAYKNGAVKPIPYEEVRAKLRTR